MKEITNIREITCSPVHAIIIVRHNNHKYERDAEGHWILLETEQRYGLIGWHTSKLDFVNRGTDHSTLEAARDEALGFTAPRCIFLLDATAN